MTGTLKKWLADYRIESELKLDQKEKKIVYIHPERIFEVHISNVLDDDCRNETLSLQIIVSATDINTAEELTQMYLEKFLHMLGFITSTGYKISRRICLIDWTPGLYEREVFQYTDKLKTSIQATLNSDLFQTANLLHTWEATDTLEMALRWYSAGVRSKVMEDQFQFFWFVIELIADSTTSSDKVTDKCQKCRGDLHCSSCGELSSHKPFPKQLIEKLLLQTRLPEEIIKDLFLTRNKLLHGMSRKEIEKLIQVETPKFSFDKALDFLGKAAWSAIINSFKKTPGNHETKFFTVNTFVNWNLTAKVHLRLGIGGDPNNPKIEDVSLPQVSLSKQEVKKPN